jgi:hypothetical protein
MMDWHGVPEEQHGVPGRHGMSEEQALHSYRSADLDMNMNKIERSRGIGSKS